MVQSPGRSSHSQFLRIGEQLKELDISVSQRMMRFVHYDIVKLLTECVVIVLLCQQGHNAGHLHPLP